MPKARVKSVGCKLSQSEADLWKAWFLARGYELSGRKDVPHVCLVTTCTVTEAADRSSVNLVRRLARTFPDAEIWVTGCGAERIPERWRKLPGVTRIISYQEKEGYITGSGIDATGTSNSIHRNRAFLRVGDGCDRGCAYCIVSRIRGSVKSKDRRKIIEELCVLYQAGFGEVVLTSLNLGLWGTDKGIGLSTLIKEIDDHKAPLPRIRLTSLEPDTLTDELLEAIAGCKKICPHLHIPLQSGDDEILQEMLRPYTTNQYSELVGRVLRMMPEVNIGTDVICATPFEDEASFSKTVAFVKSLPLGYLHAFTYSPRPGTPMAEIKKQVRSPRERTKMLRELGAEKLLTYQRRFVGKTRQAVILAPHRVLTDNYIDVSVTNTTRPLRSLAGVKITAADGTGTQGKIV